MCMCGSYFLLPFFIANTHSFFLSLVSQKLNIETPLRLFVFTWKMSDTCATTYISIFSFMFSHWMCVNIRSDRKHLIRIKYFLIVFFMSLLFKYVWVCLYWRRLRVFFIGILLLKWFSDGNFEIFASAISFRRERKNHTLLILFVASVKWWI